MLSEFLYALGVISFFMVSFFIPSSSTLSIPNSKFSIPPNSSTSSVYESTEISSKYPINLLSSKLTTTLNVNSTPAHVCSGINIGYIIENILKIPVNSSKFHHPYGFRSKLELVNLGSRNLLGWKIVVNFTRNELITSVSNCQVKQDLPAEGRELIFQSVAGVSDTVITAINAAGDVNQYSLFAEVIGTGFFRNASLLNASSIYSTALPSSLSLVDAFGYSCDVLKPNKLTGNKITVCCEEVDISPPPSDPTIVKESPKADMEIRYDILSVYASEYTALVTISNNQKFRRIPFPGWNLSWSWRANEIIWDMRGAEAISTGNCLDSYARDVFKDNVQSAHSCMPRPTISDLDASSYYKNSYRESPDFTLLSCCKNGTLGATGFPSGDPSMEGTLGNATYSQFKMKVGTPKGGLQKILMPADFDVGIKGIKCGGPYRVVPTNFPLTVDRKFQAYASWKIDCNHTSLIPSAKSCCVSFSSYFNKTKVGKEQPLVAPCKACACACGASIPNSLLTCPADSKQSWVEYSPPCSDQCGFNVHWRVQQVYKGGWLAQIVVYNRGRNVVKDWFMAATIPSFQNVSDVYSFQYANHSESTLLMWGFKYTNDWLLGTTKTQKRMSNVQSVIKFGETDNFSILDERGSQVFPTKIVLNGEECELPEFYPMYDGTPKKKTFLDQYKMHLGVALAGLACVVLAYLLANH